MKITGFQKPVNSQTKQGTLVAIISTSGESPVITCNCKWGFKHERAKVRERAAQRHLDKHHGGRGIWL